MEILRIPVQYFQQIKFCNEKDCDYILKTIFELAENPDKKIENSMRGGLVASIYREAVQMENKARAKKGKKRLDYKLATLTPPLSQKKVKKVATKSSQVTSNQIKSNQIKSRVSKETAKPKTFGNEEISQTLNFLKKSVGVETFKETEKMQRNFGKHFLNLLKKIGKKDFTFRLEEILKDNFKSKNSNSLKYLYSEMKSFIVAPLVSSSKVAIL